MKLSDFKTTKELTDMLEQVFAEGTPAVRSTNPMYINTEALRDGVKASAPAHSEAFPNGSSVNLYQNRDGTYRIEYRPAPTIWNDLTLNEAMARLAPYIRDNARPYA